MKHTFFSQSRGFTLVELLISMVIIMLIGTMILVVFFTALRGAQKSQQIITLRQNGTFALSQLTKSLRDSEKIISYGACSDTGEPPGDIRVVSYRDHGETRYRCDFDNDTIASESANPAELLNKTGNFTLSACSFRCGTKNFDQFITVSFELTPNNIPSPGVNDIATFTSTVFLPNQLTE